MLRVTERTLHNWITGRHAVPYSAFKLVRVLRRMDIPLPGWEGWTFCTGYLYSPEGHRFSGKDSAWWSLLVRRARMFSSVYDENMRLRQRLQALEAGASTVPLVPDFLAPAGREVHVTPHFSPTSETNHQKTTPSSEARDLLAARCVGGAKRSQSDGRPAGQTAPQHSKRTKAGKLACTARRAKSPATVAPSTPMNPDSSALARLSRFLPRGAQ